MNLIVNYCIVDRIENPPTAKTIREFVSKLGYVVKSVKKRPVRHQPFLWTVVVENEFYGFVNDENWWSTVESEKRRIDLIEYIEHVSYVEGFPSIGKQEITPRTYYYTRPITSDKRMFIKGIPQGVRVTPFKKDI